MQPADSVAVRRSVQRQDRHGERLVAVENVAPSQGHQLLEVDMDLVAIVGEVVIHQAGVENIDAGGNGRVGGENVAGARGFQSFLEIQVLVAHEPADLFQREEGRVAFIHVVHGRPQPHGFQCPHAADSQHDLLADAGIDVAPIERIGDIAILREDVIGDVGVQQKQRDAAHVELPDLDEDVACGKSDRHLQVAPFGVFDRSERQGVEIVHRVAFLLPPVGVEQLPEIALLIQQAKADQRIVLVARRLQMVAGENAQTAGIDRQALGEPVFGGKVSDQVAVSGRIALVRPPVVRFAGAAVQRQVAGIARRSGQGRLRNTAQHQDWIMAGFAPHNRVQTAKQRTYDRLPTP